MFLKPSVLNNLMKKAYKSGLVLAMNEKGWLYIASDWWQVSIKREFILKRTLGDIIALAGELPEPGERFTCTKEGNQIEMEMPNEIDETPYKGESYLTPTDLLMIGNQGVALRVLQSEETGYIYIVNNVFMAIVDNNQIDEEHGEYGVERPLYNPYSGILWRNNVCKLRAHFRSDDKVDKLMKALGTGIDLTPEVPE